MTDLTTTYMGLTLKNPIVPSASPLSKKIERHPPDGRCRRGRHHDVLAVRGADRPPGAGPAPLHRTDDLHVGRGDSYFPKAADFNRGPDGYLDLIREAKAAVDVPIIGSLNGVTTGGWTRYAKLIEEAGADALELNVYLIPTRTDLSSDGVENTYLEILREVKAQVKIPVAMKLSPFFSAMPNMAYRLDRAGADALVLFNRFYQPDFDLEELTVVPHLVLSNSNEMRLPLRWVAILYGHVKASLALTTGIHSTDDAVKAIMAGADVANVASLLLERGAGAITDLVSGIDRWMEEHEYETVAQMKGALSQRNVAEPAAFERANYMKVLGSWK